jgi:hypothetical protein
MTVASWFVVLGTVAWCVAPLFRGTAAAAAAQSLRVPRTTDGVPDLEGAWNFGTLTPLERPAELAGRASMTDQEALARVADSDRRAGRPEVDFFFAPVNEFWNERGPLAQINGRFPTSLIVDPPDGRRPAPTPQVQARAAARAARVRTRERIEDFPLSERCLRSAIGPPYIPTPDANMIHIVQGRDRIAIVQEKFHETRVVILDGRAHVSPRIGMWMGDARGRWEGDTLVVDTKNFTNQLALGDRYDENLHLVERFTLTAPDTLLYQATIDDPTTFTSRWSLALPMRKTGEQLFEFACHEGNYSLPNILRGARAQETTGPQR